jgi:hypothetical protein
MSTHTFSTSAKPKGAAAAAVALDNETSRKRFRRATSRRELVHSHPRVPTTFEWTGPGHEVFLLGSFSNWVEKHPMTLYEVLSDHIEHLLTISSEASAPAVFRCTLDIPIGIHSYKFMVDGEWRFATDQPTLPDPDGNINNVIAVRMPVLPINRMDTTSAHVTT